VTPLDALAFDFFREFARCEYCLKAIGFLKDKKSAEANWVGRFAQDVQDVIENSAVTEVQAAVKYFLDNPPRKQVVKNSQLEWDETLPDYQNKTELVLLLVCRVRNNLFHGGKFNGRYFEPQRSEELMTHGLVVLRACREAHSNMRLAYAERADQ